MAGEVAFTVDEEFQFLIGRLATFLHGISFFLLVSFQFLIGRLATRGACPGKL